MMMVTVMVMVMVMVMVIVMVMVVTMVVVIMYKPAASSSPSSLGSLGFCPIERLYCLDFYENHHQEL